MTRVLVFADLHLKHGSPYDREPGDRLEDQVKAYKQIPEIARAHGCELLINGGDSLDGATVQTEAYEAFHQIFGDCEIPMVAISGNNTHDAGRRSVKAPEVAALTIPSMQVFTREAVVECAGVAVACLPWGSAGQLIAANEETPRGEINQWISAHLISIARGLKAECVERYPDIPHLLVGHWGVEGAATESGIEITQLTEPWLPIADLEALGFDLVACGHIHPPKLLAPNILSIGAPMQLKFGERGDRGVWIVDFQGPSAAGTKITNVEFVPILSRSFEEIEYDPDDWPHIEFAEAMVMENIVKLSLHVTAEQNKRIDRRKLTAALYEAGAWKVMPITPDVERETRARVEGVDETLDASESLDLWLKTQGIDKATGEEMHDRTRRYLQEVGA